MNKKEQIINEVWSAITHGLGLGLGIWAFVRL